MRALPPLERRNRNHPQKSVLAKRQSRVAIKNKNTNTHTHTRKGKCANAIQFEQRSEQPKQKQNREKITPTEDNRAIFVSTRYSNTSTAAISVLHCDAIDFEVRRSTRPRHMCVCVCVHNWKITIYPARV